MPRTSEDLIALLDIEQIDDDLFRGRQPDTERQQVFGGQVAAQAVQAAERTVDPDFVVHSLHSYFLLPGDHTVPIIFDVDRIRDGRSFATRRVAARQHGRSIYYQTVSFQRHEDGFEHQDRMPADVPGPEDCPPFAEVVGRPEFWDREWGALDVRHAGASGHGLADDPERPALARRWIRIAGDLGDDPLMQAAAFTYASDMTLLGTSMVPHLDAVARAEMKVASLDHTIWFHRPFRADRWWLYDQHSPFAGGGRGFSWARVFTEDGTLVASLAQEGLIRRR